MVALVVSQNGKETSVCKHSLKVAWRVEETPMHG
jgi:hypothetical protein